jgi:hypothetical protein
MKGDMVAHDFEAIRPRAELVIHLEASTPEGHGWPYAEMLTNTDLLQAHVRAHHPEPDAYEEPK